MQIQAQFEECLNVPVLYKDTGAKEYSCGLCVVKVSANAEKFSEPSYHVLKYFQLVVMKVIQAKSVSKDSKKLL